jgi:hypothetical protein
MPEGVWPMPEGLWPMSEGVWPMPEGVEALLPTFGGRAGGGDPPIPTAVSGPGRWICTCTVWTVRAENKRKNNEILLH